MNSSGIAGSRGTQDYGACQQSKPKVLDDEERKALLTESTLAVFLGAILFIVCATLQGPGARAGAVVIGLVAAVPMTAGLVGLSTIILQAVSRVRQDMNDRREAKGLTKRLLEGKKDVFSYQART